MQHDTNAFIISPMTMGVKILMHIIELYVNVSELFETKFVKCIDARLSIV